jgi:hypothetical protein
MAARRPSVSGLASRSPWWRQGYSHDSAPPECSHLRLRRCPRHRHGVPRALADARGGTAGGRLSCPQHRRERGGPPRLSRDVRSRPYLPSRPYPPRDVWSRPRRTNGLRRRTNRLLPDACSVHGPLGPPAAVVPAAVLAPVAPAAPAVVATAVSAVRSSTVDARLRATVRDLRSTVHGLPRRTAPGGRGRAWPGWAAREQAPSRGRALSRQRVLSRREVLWARAPRGSVARE